MFFLSHALTLVFVIFKIEGSIDWSWILVFSPMIAFWVLVILIIFGLGLFVKWLK